MNDSFTMILQEYWRRRINTSAAVGKKGGWRRTLSREG
jgi:hypothetical protein